MMSCWKCGAEISRLQKRMVAEVEGGKEYRFLCSEACIVGMEVTAWEWYDPAIDPPAIGHHAEVETGIGRTCIVLSEEAYEKLIDDLERPAKPTLQLVGLMRDTSE